MFTLSRADRRAILEIVAILTLCIVLAGCASVAPVPYSEVASSSYMAPNPSDASGRIPYRYATSVDWRAYNKAILHRSRVRTYRARNQTQVSRVTAR